MLNSDGYATFYSSINKSGPSIAGRLIDNVRLRENFQTIGHVRGRQRRSLDDLIETLNAPPAATFIGNILGVLSADSHVPCFGPVS